MENSTLIFDDYLFRCSSLGKLLTAPRNKSEVLSETTKTYLKELHKEVLFKRKKTIQSKYLDKGIQVEDKSITLYSEIIGKPFYKNKERFNNDFISGEPDNVTDKIRDIKSSYELSTFPLYDTEITNKDYLAQLNGYMWLTGLKEAELIYCLIDTPEKIIIDELRRLDWKFQIIDDYGDIKEDKIPLVVELIKNMIYTSKGLEDFCNNSTTVKLSWFEDFREIPKEFRCKVFKTKFDESMIETFKERIFESRKYLNDLSLQISNNLEVNL